MLFTYEKSCCLINYNYSKQDEEGSYVHARTCVCARVFIFIMRFFQYVFLVH